MRGRTYCDPHFRLLATVNFCRNCERFLSPPATWVITEPESRELLAICLKKLKGLSKVRLIDAGFIWTEPHSKRLRVKLTIQKEASSSRSFKYMPHPDLLPRTSGLYIHNPSADLRGRVHCAVRSMSGLHEIGRQEHVESDCPSAPKGYT